MSATDNVDASALATVPYKDTRGKSGNSDSSHGDEKVDALNEKADKLAAFDVEGNAKPLYDDDNDGILDAKG